MPTPSNMFSDTAAAAMLDDVLERLEAGGEKQGDVIGPYLLLEKLGEGGFGIVWRAEQEHPVKREVALKLLKRGMDSRQILGRFEQERRVLAAMEHPCIATMLDAGVSPDGRPYFVMEMLRGEPLTKYCEKNHLTLSDKLLLFQDVCSAVQHAHQKGVIHRDLKPSNILVTEVDSKPVPKIIDFGIAKALGSGGLQAMTLLTQANFVLGTPQYMSPEQIADGGNVDTRSDIYALGALLYEVLAGTPPFEARTLQAKSALEFQRIIQEERPKRPSTALTTRLTTQIGKVTPVTRVAPDTARLPADLDWITLRALEKEPQRRYPSAAEFAADLQRFLDNEPVLAHPPSAAYIASLWIRRHRVMFAAACMSVLALVVGAGVAIWQAKLAREAQRQAEAESLRSRETADFLTTLLRDVAGEVNKGRNPEALRLALTSSQSRLDSMTQDPDLQIALTTQVAELFEGMTDRKLAAEALRVRAERVAKRYGEHSAQARAAAFKYIHMVVDHGNRAAAVKLLTDLRGEIEKHEGRGTPNWFEAQRLLVRDWIKLRNGAEAVRAAEEASREGEKHSLSADFKHELFMQHVDALESAKRFDAALELLHQAQEFDRANDHWEGIDQKRVQILASRGDYAQAADMQETLVKRVLSIAEFNRRRLLFHMRWLAELEIKAKRYKEAEAHLDEAVVKARLFTTNLPKDGDTSFTLRSEMVKMLETRIALCNALHQPQEALAAAQEAILIAKQSGGNDLMSHALACLASVQQAAGQLDEAWETEHQLYELHATHNASHKNRLEDLRTMSNIRLRQHRPQEALKHAHDAWQQALAEPASHAEPDYLGYMAELALKCWHAVQKDNPSAPAPMEVAEWEEAVRNDPSRRPR